MGSVGDALDNAVAESFFASMQTELLDRRRIWDSRTQLANATLECVEAFYNRQRRHSKLDYKTPVDYSGIRPTAPAVAAGQPSPGCLLNGRNTKPKFGPTLATSTTPRYASTRPASA
jgi:hypothetical protein